MARPASARGRLTREPREPREPAPLVHGCSQPPPDAGVGAGPGHFRHFVAATSAKHQLKDPLRQGEDRECEFYSMAQKHPGRDTMRTLDISRVNQERHKWQRIDTFQTPYGNGQAYCTSPRARTGSRERTSQTQVLAGMGLEMEQLRVELKLSLADVKEELSQTIAMAVNQTISELRQDVRVETAALRHQLHLYEEARPSLEPVQPAPAEPVASAAVPAEDREKELLSLQALHASLGASLETSRALLSELRQLPVPAPPAPEVPQAPQEQVPGLELRQAMEEVAVRVERMDQSQAMQMDQVFARLEHLDQNQCSLMEKMDLSTVRQITDLQASSRLLEEAVRAVAEAQQREHRREPRAEEPVTAAVTAAATAAATAERAEVLRLLEEVRRAQTAQQLEQRALLELRPVERPEPEALVELRRGVEEIKGRLGELDQLPLLKDLQKQLGHALHAVQAIAERPAPAPPAPAPAPVLDLSPLQQPLQAMQTGLVSLREDQHAMREALRPTDLSPVLAGLELVRKALATMSQEVEISREVVVKRADVSALSQTMQNAWELMSQTKAAINKVDMGQISGDLQRVLEESRALRQELPKLARPEVDFTPIFRALQDRKRIDEEFGEKLVEEMHRLRRDLDVTQLAQSLEQVEPALRSLRGALREARGEELLPLMDEMQRLQNGFTELRQSRMRDFCQLQEEFTTVKAELKTLVPRDVDLSPLHVGLKELSATVARDLAPLAQRLDEVQLAVKISRSEEKQDQPALELQGVVEDLRLVTKNLVDCVRNETLKVDLEPLMRELQQVRSKVEVSSALKRQNEHMTKTDFATALEELRGHFSLLLSSFREVCDQSSGVSAGAVNTLLQNMLEQRQRENETTAEDLDFLRRKLRDTQTALGQARDERWRPPERPEAQAIYEPVTRIEPSEPVAQAMPRRP